MERDILSCDPTTVNDISTHTLTWSVTFFLVLLVDLNDISTHTLTWSVTTGLDTLDDELLHFNSHAHVERDIIAVLFVGLIIISTHTLTWSVTLIVANVIYTRVISTHTLTWSVTSFSR